MHKLTCAAPADFITSRCLLDRDLNLCREAMLAPWSVPAVDISLPSIAPIMKDENEQLCTWRSLLRRLCILLSFLVQVIQGNICLALGCHLASQGFRLVLGAVLRCEIDCHSTARHGSYYKSPFCHSPFTTNPGQYSAAALLGAATISRRCSWHQCLSTSDKKGHRSPTSDYCLWRLTRLAVCKLPQTRCVVLAARHSNHVLPALPTRLTRLCNLQSGMPADRPLTVMPEQTCLLQSAILLRALVTLMMCAGRHSAKHG